MIEGRRLCAHVDAWDGSRPQDGLDSHRVRPTENSVVLQLFANAKAGVGLSAQNQVLRRLAFNWSTTTTSLFVCWVPNELNPVAPWRRLLDDCSGDEALAELATSSI